MDDWSEDWYICDISVTGPFALLGLFMRYIMTPGGKVKSRADVYILRGFA